MRSSAHRPFPEPPAHNGPNLSLSQAYDVIPPRQARPDLGPRLGVVWAPLASTDLALPRIYSPSRENPRHPSTIPQKVPSRPSSPTLVREGSEALPSTLPEREIITGGFYIAMPASEVMRE